MDELLEPRRNLSHAIGGLVLAAALVAAGRFCGDSAPSMPISHGHVDVRIATFGTFMPAVNRFSAKAGLTHVRTE